MVAAITERRKEDRRAHLIEECPQADRIQAVSETLLDLKESNQRVAIALETLAARGAQVDSHEKHLDTHDTQINAAFAQIRENDKRLIILEIKKSEWEGEKKAKEEITSVVEKEKEKVRIAVEKDSQKIWTLLEKLQLLTPVLLTVGFILYILEKFKLPSRLIALIREAWPF
jgi:nitrate reductase alpha subunit